MSAIDLTHNTSAEDQAIQAQIRKDVSISSFLDFIKVPAFALLSTSAILVPVFLITHLW